MRIVLIMPRSNLYKKGRGFKRNLRYAPLNLTTLAALVPKEFNAKIRIIDEGVELVDYSKIEADLVGITCITGTSLLAYKIADSFRSRGITVVIGGPHPTLMPQEAKKHADSVAIGIANHTWPEMLKDFKKGKLKPFYQDQKIDLSGLPIPRRDLLKKGGYISTNTVQAVYGCPYKCDFCVTQVIGRGYHHRPIPEVIDEIKKLKSKLIFFLDPSPMEDKEYSKELFRQMIPLKKLWMGLSTTRIEEDKELLDLLEKSGCVGLLIGFESVSQKSLAKMNKFFNTAEKYKRFVKELHKRGISIMACFVFGSDEDEKTIFKETVDFINETGIDLPRFTVYTPFPGTPLFEKWKKEKRILTEDWNKYNAQNVVFKPKNMSVKELQEGLEWAWKEVYKTKNIIKRLRTSRTRLWVTIFSNIGYKMYAKDMPKYR
jgi:radical SAM superfamily enzyme YgiQ (UPF0313 family)